MNGASTEPCAKTSRAPTSNMTKIRGASQSFFRWRMNAHSSLVMPRDCAIESDSEFVFQITASRVRRSRFPERIVLLGTVHHGIATSNAHPQAQRRQDEVVHGAHDDRCRDLRELEREPHPQPVH